MTKFEHLSHQIESLRRKADEAGTPYVRSIWLGHTHQLEEKRRNLTIKEAMEDAHAKD